MIASRYFYADPLAAAWMMKHHGMHLLADDGYRGMVDATRRFIDVDVFSDIFSMDYLGRLYIHPDSLPLLEPRAGDLVYRGLGWDVVDRTDGSRAWFSDGDGYRYSDIEIIQRNGIPFHWPQSEQPA